jgi:cell division transport system ATP-binding protein
MVQLSQVTQSYFGQPRVLDQVNLELKKGEFVYVLGGSGAGKSTLLRLLATEERPSSGSVSLFGYNLNTVSPQTLRAIRRALGYVPQSLRLIPDLTVAENIALSLDLAGARVPSSEARIRIADAVERLGLVALRDKRCAQLSGGEAQRVSVARALVRKPDLIIADEPSGAQDPEHTWAMMDALVRANLAGATVIVATHDREMVRRIRKRCAILKGGRLQIEPVAAGMGMGNSPVSNPGVNACT